jgi:hypothetical protein
MFRFLRKTNLSKYYYQNYFYNKRLPILMCLIIPSTNSFVTKSETKNETKSETNILTKNNIDSLFDNAYTNIHNYVKKSEYYTSYEIIKKTIEVDKNKYFVFKIIINYNIMYYATDMKNKLGFGGYGIVYEGFNVITGEKIALKFCNVHFDEIVCLIKTELYIAHTQDVIIMKKAPGLKYSDILKDKSISDEMKINLHKKVINKYIELGVKHSIEHNDAKVDHIFIEIENDIITLIDFGLSTFRGNTRADIHNLNQNVKYYYTYCDESFKNYIDSLYDKTYVYEKRILMLQALTFFTTTMFIVHFIESKL